MSVDWDAIRRLRVTRLVSDSRHVQPGDTFVAYPGESRDGRAFIADAIARGAASVVWEKRGYASGAAWKVPNVGVGDLRKQAGVIASEVYGRPSARLWTVGVTGTNGKTSTSHWIAQALTATGRRCGLVGTLGSGFSAKLEPIGNTTPDAVWLQGRLRDFVRQRARAVSMEVSSHGLVQDRVAGVEFDVALLTNLSRDHLDYHGTMRAYRAAKARLFRVPTLKSAVLNLDDAFGRSLVAQVRARGTRVLGYGFTKQSVSRLPRVRGEKLRLESRGIAFAVSTPWGRASVQSRLIGRFNAENLLASLAVLLASDVSLADAVAALDRARAVAGRMQRYGGGRKPLVVVDYAHTPDALENVLKSLREVTTAKLVCVFGCGGDRDKGKRPLMGAIAVKLADQVVVTSDNPRSEKPQAIIDDIVRGIRKQVEIVPDRAEAIRAAILRARVGDVVLVAGKGHEQYQEIAGVKHPFSDAIEVEEALEEWTR